MTVFPGPLDLMIGVLIVVTECLVRRAFLNQFQDLDLIPLRNAQTMMFNSLHLCFCFACLRTSLRTSYVLIAVFKDHIATPGIMRLGAPGMHASLPTGFLDFNS